MNVSASITFVAKSSKALKGKIRVPSDKSISHRSVMLGSLANGVTNVRHFLEGEDSLATLEAFRQMGVKIDGPEQGQLVIHGVGLNGLVAPKQPLNLGNSGTSMRLMSGLMAGQQFDSVLIGDESLSTRPMQRVVRPLTQMGASIEVTEGGLPPLEIAGGQKLVGINYESPMASAQVKSCLLLAGIYAEGKTTVVEPGITRDHTERMLESFAYPVQKTGSSVTIAGGGELIATDIVIPADISSAAFFMVAASITPGSDIILEEVGINPTRVGVINILQKMGADITLLNSRNLGGEPVADVRVRHADLVGIEIPKEQVPLAIDEFPVLFIAAAYASGITTLHHAEELRVKESDRIQAMADGLTTLGIYNKPLPDGIIIHGGVVSGGQVDSFTDHRIAMSFAVAALGATGEICIRDCQNVATSFPGFIDICQSVGMDITSV